MASTIISRDPQLPLQQDERRLIDRLLGEPSALPQQFWAALIDKVITEAPSQIPIQQLQGFGRFTANTASVNTAESTTSTTYVDLATAGPTLTGLSAGRYMVFFGCELSIGTGADTDGGIMSLSYSGSVPTEDDSVAFTIAPATDSVRFCSISRSVFKTFTAADNSVKAQYRAQAAGGCTYLKRWLTVLRTGNA